MVIYSYIMKMRHYSPIDRLLIEIERAMTTVCADLHAERPNPAAALTEPVLTATERQTSRQLMRVNHTGEVCAQALYFSQMVMARSPAVFDFLEKSAQEETDHLAWTTERLKELNTHRSYLNPFWYTQSYLIGLLAGLFGDRWSLGFVEETESQVTAHLEDHLGRLPTADTKSRQITEQMRLDEQRHGQHAAQAGSRSLPRFIKRLMSLQSKVMTHLAAWV